MCRLMFPDAFPSWGPNLDASVAKVNHKYDGWDLHVDHLFFANGKRMYIQDMFS